MKITKQIFNLFEFLERNRKCKIPDILCLVYEHSKLSTLRFDDCIILQNIEDEFTLPDNLYCEDKLSLRNSNISKLPKNLYVGFRLFIQGTNINIIPKSLEIKHDIVVDSEKYVQFCQDYPWRKFDVRK